MNPCADLLRDLVLSGVGFGLGTLFGYFIWGFRR